MKIFITGAAGMLGTDVVAELIKEGHGVFQTDINQRLPEIKKLDVTDLNRVFSTVEEVHPEYIFHLAAETDVDLCEKDPKHAFKVNALGTENIAKACQKYKINLLYISTAGVFYGDKKSPYTELDEPKPKNIYGESKLRGEDVVKKLLSKYFIIRAGWMVGGWEIDKKFVYKIVKQLKEGRKELRVVADKFGSATFTTDFAKNLMDLINTKKFGLYHMTNKGTGSRYDIAVKIVEFMGLKNEVKVNPISSDQFPLPAPRADSEMIQNHNLELLGLNNMPHWQESLERYIKTNKNK